MRSKTVISLGKFYPRKRPFRLDAVSRRVPFLPYYHAVGEASDLPHISPLYLPRSLAIFKKDLETFLKYFEPVSLVDFKKNPLEKKNGKAIFHLSFDDGLRQIYEVVMPLLLEKGVPATLFFNTDFIGNKKLFYRYKAALLLQTVRDTHFTNKLRTHVISDEILDKLAEEYDVDFGDFLTQYKPYMDWEQLEDWKSKGFTIGAHSKNHRPYFEMKEEEQLRQTLESMKILKTENFSFPFNDVGINTSFFKKVKDTYPGFTSFACTGLKIDPEQNHFQRTSMEGSLASADTIIKGEYLYFALSSLIGKNKRKRSS